MHKLKLVLVWLMFFLKQRFLPSRWLYQLLALSTYNGNYAWGMFTSGPCNTPIIICMMDESAWVPYPVHLSYLSDFSWFSSSINSNNPSIKNKLATKSFTQNHFDLVAMIFWCIPTQKIEFIANIGRPVAQLLTKLQQFLERERAAEPDMVGSAPLGSQIDH